MKVTVIPIIIWALRAVLKGFVRGLEELEIRGRAETANNSITNIDQNTEKSPGNLRKHSVTHTNIVTYPTLV